MKGRYKIFIGLIFLAAAVGFIAVRTTSPTRRNEDKNSARPPRLRNNSSQPSQQLGISASASGAAFKNQRLWQALAVKITQGHAEENRAALLSFFENQFRSPLNHLSANELIEFLESGEDASTSLGFRVGAAHRLEEWPTLRVAALDWLGTLDPAAAASYAEKIFNQEKSADEFAIALRNLAFGLPQNNDALTQRFEQLLAKEDWKNVPSQGYLEAFDIAAYLVNPDLVQPLAHNISDTRNEPLRKASFVALDRMAQANPKLIIKQLLANEVLQNSPFTRAGLFSHADIRDQEQRQLVESYLLNTKVQSQEISSFAEAFPNGSATMVYGLVSENRNPSFAELAQQDQSSLKWVREWLGDKRFAARQPELQKLESRLESYVASAVRGGILPTP